MTDQIDIEALGRRARACPHFRWLPGMLLVGATVPARYPWSPGDPVLKCSPVRVTSVDGDGYPWGQFSTGTRGGWGSFRDGVPDLSDACTRGGLLEIVREAWGRPVFAACDRGDERWRVYQAHREYVVGQGRSEAAALVAALEAAPR